MATVTSLSQLPAVNSIAANDLLELSVFSAPSSYESKAVRFEDAEKSMSVYNTVSTCSSFWVHTDATITCGDFYQSAQRSVYYIDSLTETSREITYDYTGSLAPAINNAIYVVNGTDVTSGDLVTIKLPDNSPYCLGFITTISKCITGSDYWTQIKVQIGDDDGSGLIGNGRTITATDQLENYTTLTVQCISISPVSYAVIGGHGTWTNSTP
jgi:hypothetical protein